jgi:signal transduction histidine kinase
VIGGGSLRLRLLLAGSIGIAIASLAAALLLGAAFERAALDAFDRRLADDLVTVAGLVAADGDDGFRLRREPADDRFARVFSGHYWRVGDGATARHSRSLWDHPLALAPPPADAAVRFGSTAGPMGQQLRTAERMIRLPGATVPIRVWVASDEAGLRAEIGAFRWLAGASVAALAALLLLAAVWQVGYGLRPLRAMAGVLERVESGESERIEMDGVPAEVRPVVAHLNRLLARHDDMVRRARDATQDLAHALKTPLAVLDAEAQRPGPAFAATVADQVGRIRSVIERELAAVRPADTRRSAPVADIAGRLVQVLGRVHAERELALELSVAPSLRFRGAPEDLEEMLGNLLDNACKWARSRVRVSAGAGEDGGLWIEVEDDGPGMSAADRELARGRGVRLDERVPGNGLGLDIVARIARAHGGELLLDASSSGGLAARLRFGGGSGG